MFIAAVIAGTKVFAPGVAFEKHTAWSYSRTNAKVPNFFISPCLFRKLNVK